MQFADDKLVDIDRRWRHEQLAVDELVPLTVVLERVEHLDGEIPARSWHRHTIGPSG